MSATHAPRPRARAARRGPWLAVGLGVIAFLPFLLVFMQGVERDDDLPVQLEAGDEEALSDGLRMVSPSFAGRTDGGEPYVVTADWALPDAPNPNRVALRGVEASVTLDDGRVAALVATDGAFFPRIKRLRLENGVSATTSDGYRLDTDAATVDAAERTLLTDAGVTATGPGGSIRADRLEALDSGDRIVKFLGNVVVTYDPVAADIEESPE